MLRSLKSILGYSIEAEDGKLGKLHDVYFDDRSWMIRYFVIDTGGFLIGRKVLVSPVAAGRPDWDAKILPVSLTRDQIKDSPELAEGAAVSREYEGALAGYYGWPTWWGAGAGTWNYPAMGSIPGYPGAPVPSEMPGETASSIDASRRERAPAEPAGAGGEETEKHPEREANLKSGRDLDGDPIHARDGDIGHVQDFIVDDESWMVRYMVVDTSRWLAGKKVLVSTDWIEPTEWRGPEVKVNLTKEEIRHSPQYDPKQPVNREIEERLYDFYGRPRYWTRP